MEVLTVTEVAKLVQVSRTVVYELIMSGEIPSFKVGKLRRIRRSDVEAWLAKKVEGNHG
jgi:excisionase family DNA binding protein